MKELEERAKRPQTEEQRALEYETEGFNRSQSTLISTKGAEIGVGMAKKEMDWVDEKKRF